MTTDARPPEPKPERRRALNVTLRIGETVAVLGLVLGLASFLVGRADRRAEEAEERQAKAEASQQQARATALVLRGTVDGEGERVLLDPVDPEQIVQTQTYLFPRAVRERGREIDAGRPQIDAVWIADGLKRERRTLEKAGVEPPAGEDEAPVAVVTAFIQDGDTRTDRAIYRVGYRIEDNLLGRSDVKLTGVSLIRRMPQGDLQAELDRLWAQSRPAAFD